MKGTCHIHIGLHKTGSTSIQKMLAAEHGRLAAAGFYCASTGRNQSGVAHHFLAEEVNRRPRSGSSLFEALESEVEAQGWPPNVVLTSEAFCTRIHHPRVVARLKELSERLGYRPRVMAYVRPQETAIHSVYTQRLKMWTFKGDFESFWPRVIDDIAWDYEQRFGALFDSDVEVSILPFSRRVIIEGVCRNFLSALGLPQSSLNGFIEPARANVSPGPKAIAAILEVNQELDARGIKGTRRTLEAVAHVVRRTNRLIGPEEDQFNALSPAVSERIRARFQNTNARFAVKAFGREWDEVFAEDLASRRELNIFDPASAKADEQQAFEAFVADMVEAICELAA
jgi:hypothetical protein